MLSQRICIDKETEYSVYAYTVHQPHIDILFAYVLWARTRTVIAIRVHTRQWMSVT